MNGLALRSMRFAAPLVLVALLACSSDDVDPAQEEPLGDAAPAAVEDAGAEAPPVPGTLSFARYHTQEEIHAYLAGLAADHPGLVRFEVLGASRQGREIAYVVVSNADPATVPALYFNGTHHGDEWSSTEGILGLADHLVTHRDEPAVRAVLEKYAVWLQPLVNPDGHAAKTRADSRGVDPNRDYAYPERDDSRSFAVPEIALVKSLVDRIAPRAAVAYHSGAESVLWSWCYSGTRTPDDAALSATSRAAAEAMGFDRWLQSYDDYASQGEFIDYAYWRHRTQALTFEVSAVKTPAERDLAAVVATSVKGAVAVIDAVTRPAPLATRSLAPRASLGALGKRTSPRLE